MLEDAKELVRLRQAAPGPLVWRGLAHLLLKDSVSSLSDIDRAVELDPEVHQDSPWIHALRGLALVQADRPIEANAAFDDALELNRDFAVALLGRASGRAALGNLIGAVDDLTQVLELDPDNVDLLTCRGDHYVELNDFAAAESDYERAMNIAGRSPITVLRYLSARSKRSSMNKSNTPGSSDSRSDAETRTRHIEPTDGPGPGWFSRLISRRPQEHGLSYSASRRGSWKSPRGTLRGQSLGRTVAFRMSR
jgi:tetratricopeptide (TPR) repeat protein